jgi:hypothetical protein
MAAEQAERFYALDGESRFRNAIAVVGGDGRRIITKRVMAVGTQVDALRLVGQFLDKWAPGGVPRFLSPRAAINEGSAHDGT